MDSIYYVTHPRIEKAAVVYAPSTEKARTTFLDWLERNNLIKRSHRGYFRENMVAEGIEDPNVPCDVILNYGYKDFTGRFDSTGPIRPMRDYEEDLRESEREFPRPEVHDIPTRLERPEVHDFSIVPEEVDDEEPSVEIGEWSTEAKKRMPIQDVMLRGYVE